MNNDENEENDDNLPPLVDIQREDGALAHALIETQGQTHFIDSTERNFDISIVLDIETSVDAHEEKECEICYDSKAKNRFVKLNCNHECCASCIIQTMNNTNQYREPCCAFCRTTMTNFTVGSEEDLQILQERIV